MKKAILFTIMMCLALLISACSNKTDEPASGPQTESITEEETSEATTDSFEQNTEEKEQNMDDSETVTITTAESEETAETMGYDFEQFSNVNITGIDISSLSGEELAVLYAQARYCQAMTDADIDTMRELVSEDMVFTHMSGMQQTREEYFADVADGSLNYFTIGIADPVIKVDSDKAQITYTSVLNANAYGARGTYRMKGTHHYEKRDGTWITVNR